MNSVLTGVNVCDGFLPGEYRSRTLCHLSLQAQNLQQTSLIQCINVQDELSVPVGTEVHPALSQITILVQPASCPGCIRI